MLSTEASAPASSGNLGPGFDTLALALDIRCRVKATPADRWAVAQLGPHRPSEDSHDLVEDVARTVSTTPLSIEVWSDIPLCRGLGSSAAARAATTAAAAAASEVPLTADEVYASVARSEEHPDNAAAAVYGGLMTVGPDNEPGRLELHESLAIVVAVPEELLPTSEARDVLSPTVSRQVLRRTLGRTVSLIEGLRKADPELLRQSGGDEAHELPRASLHPAAQRLMDAARGAGALHACWSGAGPSVAAFTTDPDPVVDALEAALDGGGRVLRPQVARKGLIVSTG